MLKIRQLFRIKGSGWSRKKTVIVAALMITTIVAGVGGSYIWGNDAAQSSAMGNFPGGEMPERMEGMFGGEMPEGMEGMFGGERPQGSDSMGNMTGMGGMSGAVSASGITSIGITQEELSIDSLTTRMYVEEVYVSSGQELTVGQEAFLLASDSVAAAREELEALLKEADLAYRTGTIEYEQKLITAKYDRDLAVLEGEQAKEVYNQTIASLDSDLTAAQEELADTKAQIAEYQALIAENDYYNTYKVGEYKALYDENLELLKKRMEEWGVSWAQVTGSGSSGQMSGSTNSGNMGGGANSGNMGGTTMPNMGDMTGVGTGAGGSRAATGSDPYGYVQVLSGLYDVLEQNLKDYEQALADYEDANANARLELQTLEISLSSLEEEVAQANIDYESKLAEAKLTLSQSQAEAERAESDYEDTVQKAQADYETLKETWEEATQNLEYFEAAMGTGIYYVQTGGQVTGVSVRQGQYISGGSTLLRYRNREDITVTVSVDQTDIAKVTVGGSVTVQTDGYGTLSGVVTGVNPVSTSESRTNVTYQVTVQLDGDNAGIPANETVTVIFGLGGSRNEATE